MIREKMDHLYVIDNNKNEFSKKNVQNLEKYICILKIIEQKIMFAVLGVQSTGKVLYVERTFDISIC